MCVLTVCDFGELDMDIMWTLRIYINLKQMTSMMMLSVVLISLPNNRIRTVSWNYHQPPKPISTSMQLYMITQYYGTYGFPGFDL